MTALLPIRKAEAQVATTHGWRIHLAALTIAAVAILLLFHRDAAAMAQIWWKGSTFNHCLFILPIIAWLVWQRLPELRRLEPAGWAPGLLLVGFAAALWLIGEAGGVALVRHAALVMMLQGIAIACLGKSVARGLAFPIFYALFLIPAGEELVPPLQTATAEMSRALLVLAGVPAHIEGVFITTPTGYFEVAEACSGMKFLIAMIAYGTLVANVCFRSWTRRILFMTAAVAIPILANGVRAWGTIYVAYLTSNDFASSFDHVVYGWFFFGFVIVLLMAAGWPFFDRRPSDPWIDVSKCAPAGAGVPVKAVSAAAVAVAALPLAWSSLVASVGTHPPPAAIVLPSVPGWQPLSGEAQRPWRPHFAGADRVRMSRYRNAAGQEVDLAIAVFSRQEEGREIVGFGQGAIGPESRWAWTASAAPPPGGRADLIASFGTVREVATFYRVGSILTGSEVAVKLETIKTRLFGGPQRAVAVLVSSVAPADGVDPRPAIDSFLRALGPIAPLADRAAGLPQTL